MGGLGFSVTNYLRTTAKKEKRFILAPNFQVRCHWGQWQHRIVWEEQVWEKCPSLILMVTQERHWRVGRFSIALSRLTPRDITTSARFYFLNSSHFSSVLQAEEHSFKTGVFGDCCRHKVLPSELQVLRKRGSSSKGTGSAVSKSSTVMQTSDFCLDIAEKGKLLPPAQCILSPLTLYAVQYGFS